MRNSIGLFDGLIVGGFLGFWCVFVGTVWYYCYVLFFMGLKIVELGKFFRWIPSTNKRGTVCPLILEKYYVQV